MDLADGHLKGLKYLDDNSGWHAFNLGTGLGISVIDMVKNFEDVNQVKIPYKITNRRSGDVAESYSNSKKANIHLQWYSKKDIKDMCLDTWRFQKKLNR